nr:hypothetical protein [Tanacetum cinerariifolium]
MLQHVTPILQARLVETQPMVSRFSREQDKPLGKIELDLRATPSTIHGMMKFPTPRGIATLVSQSEEEGILLWKSQAITMEVVIMKNLVKISKKARIRELKRRHLKIIVLTSNTPYPSRKIRIICSCTSQKTMKETRSIHRLRKKYRLSLKNDMSPRDKLEEEKAHQQGKVYNWETAKYDFFKDFENEFPAIVYNDALTSKSEYLTEPTLCPQHIDEFDLKDETSEYDEVEQNIFYFNELFPFNIIYHDDLKSDKDNDDDKIDIIQSSRGNVNTQRSNKLLEASHDKTNEVFIVEDFIMELNGNLVSKNGYDVLDMALPPRDQRYRYLRFEGLQYTDTDIVDFRERLERIYDREVHRVLVFNFGRLTEQMEEGLRGRMLMEHKDAQGHSSEWPTCSWKDDAYCNGGNLPGAYITGNTLCEQYEALKDGKLKEEALKNKVIMDGMIYEDDESSNEGWKRWDESNYTNRDNKESENEMEHEEEERSEVFDDHERP